jgi:hypothetical protein
VAGGVSNATGKRVPVMTKIALLLVMASSVLTASTRLATAASGFFTGNTLPELCDDPSEKGESLEYVAGVADVLYSLAEDGSSFAGFRPCLPTTGVNVSQLADVVIRYLRAHPELRHETAASLVAEALTAAFRCR